MKRNRKTYSVFHVASAVIMILALLWLTLSAPFVFASQQELSKQGRLADSKSYLPETEEESANPFGNNTEEKNSKSSSSVSEEYLHDSHSSEYFLCITARFHKCENASAYISYHGELLVPPPNFA